MRTAQEGKQNEQGWERQSLAVNREYSVVSGTDWKCFIWKQFSPKKELLGGGRPRAALWGQKRHCGRPKLASLAVPSDQAHVRSRLGGNKQGANKGKDAKGWGGGSWAGGEPAEVNTELAQYPLPCTQRALSGFRILTHSSAACTTRGGLFSSRSVG